MRKYPDRLLVPPLVLIVQQPLIRGSAHDESADSLHELRVRRGAFEIEVLLEQPLKGVLWGSNESVEA